MIIEIPQLNKSFEVELASDSDPTGNLLAQLASRKIPIAKSCGGEGVCGTCKIYLEGDELPTPGPLEKRLIARKRDPACRFACLIQIPHASKKWVIRSDYW